MKDGSLYYPPGPGADVLTRPQARLQPEAAAEEKARIAAVAAAQRYVAGKYPQFAHVTPGFYAYLVRIHRADGTTTDVWVSPNLEGAFWYDVKLTPLGAPVDQSGRFESLGRAIRRTP